MPRMGAAWTSPPSHDTDQQCFYLVTRMLAFIDSHSAEVILTPLLSPAGQTSVLLPLGTGHFPVAMWNLEDHHHSYPTGYG